MSHTQASVAPPGGNSEITLQFVVRDFVGIYKTGTPAGRNRTTHPDFERVSVAEKGIILPFLGPDRVRVSASSRIYFVSDNIQ